MLKGLGKFTHAVDVHAALMRERARAGVGLLFGTTRFEISSMRMTVSVSIDKSFATHS